MRLFITLYSVLCLGVCPGLTLGSDLAREARLAKEIADYIVDGDVLYLKADNKAFLAIYTETDAAKPRGAVILLHGRGFHPDWPEVISPLRTALPAHGWHTLSLQMPVLHKRAKYYDYVPIFPEAFPRIKKGIEFLRANGISTIVLVAHSCSVHMSMAYLDAHGDTEIQGYVGIGMGATDFGQPMRKPFPLAKLKVPVLDVYGSEEYSSVLRMAPRRAAAIKTAGHAHSAQTVIKGAEHYFKDENKTGELIDVVATWLNGLSLRD